MTHHEISLMIYNGYITYPYGHTIMSPLWTRGDEKLNTQIFMHISDYFFYMDFLECIYVLKVVSTICNVTLLVTYIPTAWRIFYPSASTPVVRETSLMKSKPPSNGPVEISCSLFSMHGPKQLLSKCLWNEWNGQWQMGKPLRCLHQAHLCRFSNMAELQRDTSDVTQQ